MESSAKFAQSQIEAPGVAAYGLVSSVAVIPYLEVSVSASGWEFGDMGLRDWC